ncbi:MAG TPA: SigE family RNA polymerase sigma factor [Nocardioides sp.]|uniref:SigE family RNA polymerase sigma factor n=1 Tax=Nocardioides sp. TaxID=35761 RepID=UPI002F3F8BC8
MRQEIRDAEFSEYVAAQRVRLVRTARLLTAGDHAEAEDVVQVALTRLYVYWPRVRRADDPVAYGFRALTNAFLDERRRAHRRREVPTEITPDTAEPAVDHETRSTVLAALHGLPPRQRAVVVLRHFLQYDVAATAHALGCSEGTVKSQNAKALNRLREVLGAPLTTQEGPNR